MAHFNVNTAKLTGPMVMQHNSSTHQLQWSVPYIVGVRDTVTNIITWTPERQKQPSVVIQDDLTSGIFTVIGFRQLTVGMWDQARNLIISQESLDSTPGDERVYLQDGITPMVAL